MIIVDTLDKFYHYLNGQRFIIHTDHVTLTWLKNIKNLRGHWSIKLSMITKLNNKRFPLKLKLICYPGQLFQKISHTMYISLILNEIKEVQNTKYVTAIGKKYIEINDAIAIKKKDLSKIVFSMHLQISLLEKIHT